jgi:transcription antitermination factor NusG
MADGHSWFAVQTRPKYETSVADLLRIKGYDSFFPVYRESRRRSGQWIESERPLFPCYVFCRLTDTVWGKVVLTAGVVRLLGFGSTPAEIPGCEIDSLKRVNGSDVSRVPWVHITSGTRIRVESGPLKGVEGIYSQDSDHRRLILSVEMLQRSVAVSLDTQVAIRIVAL